MNFFTVEQSINGFVAGRLGPNRERTEKKNELGAKLKSLRLSKGMTALEMVGKLQVADWPISPQVLSNLEAGNRLLTDRELLLILRVLGAKFSDLD